jgi:NAD(P)-dependent dehydrogenase (short-subunit alcohol dehydrogenase family)
VCFLASKTRALSCIKNRKIKKKKMRGLAIVVLLLATLYGTLHWYCFTPVVFGGAVLITGASSGIGRDAAFYLAERNFTVFASYRKEADGASLTKEAKERGLANKLIPIALDVLDESSIQKAIDAVRASQLPLVALINNAGIGGGAPLELVRSERIGGFLLIDVCFEKEEEARLRAIFEANYFGALKMVRHALPLLRKAKGRVVSISSLKGFVWFFVSFFFFFFFFFSGSVATPGSAAYSSSKAALDMAMRVLALEVHHQDIRVVTVQPGYIKSEIRQKVDASYVAKV